MNREIKFRVWDKENKEILRVQELDFEPTFYGGRMAIRTEQYNDYFNTEEMLLMQYTGLHDKNGKEIYEGDIVEITRPCILERGEVKFINGCFAIKSKDTLLMLYQCEINNFKLKIIGNVFENGDILNDSKNTEKN